MEFGELIWILLFFAGFLQGLFISAVLLVNRARGSGLLLALLTLIFATMLGEELIDLTELYGRWPHALLSTFTLPLLIGPLLYFYALRIGQPERRWRPWDAIHLVPLASATLLMMPFYLLSGAQKLLPFSAQTRNLIDALVLVKGLQVLAYQLAALWVCRRFLRAAPRDMRLHLLWLQRLLLATIPPVVLIHTAYYFPAVGQAIGFADSDRLSSLVGAALIYSFAYVAMKRPTFWGARRAGDPAARRGAGGAGAAQVRELATRRRQEAGPPRCSAGLHGA